MLTPSISFADSSLREGAASIRFAFKSMLLSPKKLLCESASLREGGGERSETEGACGRETPPSANHRSSNIFPGTDISVCSFFY